MTKDRKTVEEWLGGPSEGARSMGKPVCRDVGEDHTNRTRGFCRTLYRKIQEEVRGLVRKHFRWLATGWTEKEGYRAECGD